MDSHYLYLLVDLAVISLPFAFSFNKKLGFAKKWKQFIPACLITAFVFILWDVWFTQEGIWDFNPDYLLGIYFFGLPLEEYLFFICIPYACVFTYEAVRYYFPEEPFRRLSLATNFAFIAFCALLAFMISDRWYPSFTAIFCILYLAVVVKWKGERINGWFLITYLLILVPFIISNGVLTGIRFWEYPFINTAPENITDQIVRYNNGHNLRIRIFSMPVDDLLYGFLLIFMNVSLYDIFLHRKRN